MNTKEGLAVLFVLLTSGGLACSAPLEANEMPPREDERAGTSIAGEREPVSQPETAETPATLDEGADEDEEDVATPVGNSPTRGHAWAEPAISGDVVTIPVAVAASEDHVHFSVPGNDGDASYIGWLRDDSFNARATVCPCCGAQAIEWGGIHLVCRSCDTVFNLGTGVGDETCAYPEGSLPATVSGGVITMSLDELIEAYDRTAAGADTLFEPEPEPPEEEPEVPACCRR